MARNSSVRTSDSYVARGIAEFTRETYPHPNAALFIDGDDRVCPQCGSKHLQARGSYYTTTMRYQRYHCQDCGKWSRSRFNNLDADKRKSIIVGVK